MTRAEVLTLIRAVARRPPGLFRVHHTRPDLYARARRMFGSWAVAVTAAGLDHVVAVEQARRRAARRRRRRVDHHERRPMSRSAPVLAVALFTATPGAAQTVSPGVPSDSTAPSEPLVVPATLIVPTPPDFPRGKVSGYTVGDLYYNLAGDPRHRYDAKGADQGQVNIDGRKTIGRDLSGAQLRRVYFQLDNDLTARISTRFRLEVDGKELSSGGKLGVFVKNAYLLVKSAIPRGDFLFGELTTPMFEGSEAFWQYRAVEKTVADFWGLRSSSDLGVQLRGWADPDHHVGYNLMLGNGSGQKPEGDRFKVVYFSAPVRWGSLRLEPYVDYQALRVNAGRAAVSDTVVNNDQSTWKVFAGYEFRRWALGAEALARVNRMAGKPNQEPRGYSLFARGTFHPQLAGFVRFDRWQPDKRAADRVDTRLWIAGLDWQPVKDVHVIPNVEATQYLARGTGRAPANHDLQARLTFHYLFSRPQS
jgi:hypothetical protein